MTSRRRPTQADVARLAGVSQSTVSMVLNQRDGGSILISEDTVEKVRNAMQVLGYAPDPIAQMLAQGRNRLLGIFNYDPTNSYLRDGFYYKILAGIENGADQHGYNILLLTRNRADQKRSIFEGGVNTLRLADGAILMGKYPNHDELRRLTREGYPFVYIGRRDVPEIEFDWVISDYHSAGKQATQHLIDLKHRVIGYVCESSAFDANSTQERWRGCQEVVQATPDAQLILIDQSVVADPAQLRDLLQTQHVTALICNDAINFREANNSLIQISLRVPDDISILSLGDTLGDFATSLRVTYVRLNQEQVGEAAVNRLVSRLDGSSSDRVQQSLIPCEFVVGDTTTWRGSG